MTENTGTIQETESAGGCSHDDGAKSLPAVDLKLLEPVLAHFLGSTGELIPALQAVQKEFGFLPEEAIGRIADFMHVPESKVFGVATFYTMFRFKPVGRNHICICRGTACHVRGADQILEHVERHLGIQEGDTTEDGEFSLETVACIGCCALAPCMTINDEVHGRLTPKKVTKTIKTSAKETAE